MANSPLDPEDVLGLSREKLPRHIAIIMDGNGRWAQAQGKPRIDGHARGAKNVREIVTHCSRLGVEVLTLYCFSTENWKRPQAEVDFLMELYVGYLLAERETIMDNNVRFRHIGRRDNLSDSVLKEMDETTAMSRKNTGLTLCLALNYGAREEIVDAIRNLVGDVEAGRLAVNEIDEIAVSNALYTVGLPDPDLLIRTADEQRISNFLLWQISYAEIYVSSKLWPEFGVADLNAAIKGFAARERRFGDVNVGIDESTP